MLTANQITYLFIVSLFGSLAAAVFAYWRSKRLPIVEGKESMLTKRVLKLENEHILLQEMLIEKQAEIVELRERVRLLEIELERARPGALANIRAVEDEIYRKRMNLVLAIGNDAMLSEDLMLLRGLPNIRLEVINDVTSRDLESLLGDRRAAGRPIENLHLSVHANQNVVMFSDTEVGPLWLSDRLSGVKVLMIAGCESSGVGRLLAVVPFVITVRDTIDNHGAALFTKNFWQAISEGARPRDAAEKAMVRSTSVIREMVDIYDQTQTL